MEKIRTVQEGVEKLFIIGQIEPIDYTYIKAPGSSSCDYLLFGNSQERVPILSWRYSTKNNTLYKRLPELGKPSMLKIACFSPNSERMEHELFRELDLAEYILRSKITSIVGYGSEKAANFIARMVSGEVVNLEMAVTMPKESKCESRHTVFTDNGMISDMAADSVIVKEQVHLFSEKEKHMAFSDADVNLFGLSMDEQDTCYAIYSLLNKLENQNEWKDREAYLVHLVDGAMSSLRTGKKYLFKN